MAFVDAARLRKELAESWRWLGKQESESGSGVLRACSMTLLVVTGDTEDPQALGEVLADLNHEYPSRTIVLRLSERSDVALDGRVSVSCWKPLGKRQQICSEQVELTASRDQAGQMERVILGLLVADLPVVLWCRRPDLLPQRLLHLSHKVIVDGTFSPSIRDILQVLAGLEGHVPALADLAWTRITRWREILNQVLSGRAAGVEQVEIAFAGSAVPSTAGYLGAWLHRSLPRHPGIRWTPLPQEDLIAGVGRIRSVVLTGSDLSVRLDRPAGVEAKVRVDGVSGQLHFPLQTLASVLRDEVAIAGADRVFDESWRLAAGLLSPLRQTAG